jgi:hypothetical protein
MLHRSIVAAIAVVTAAVLLPSDSAGARSGGVGGGHAGGSGFSRPNVSQFGARRFFPSLGAGFNFRNRHIAGERALSAHRRFFQFALPDGGWLYGTYDDMFGLTGAGIETANPSVEPANLQAAIYRPACRSQTQIRSVPSENGGRRDIAITRCVRPDVSSLARPAGWDSGPYAAADDRRDGDAFEVTSASGAPRKSREPDFVSAGGCRIEARTVPAEGGGERKITITRC